jgi:hypothetical protein
LAKADYPQAELYFLKCKDIREEVLPDNHPDLALTYNNLRVSDSA